MLRSRVLLSVCALVLGFPVAAAQQAIPQPTEAQQHPVFRGGTHFVRVDAYPTENGKIVEGLTPGDFEILEDGKPQTVESFDFISFEGLSPEGERRDPISQQAGFDLAADPRYRVFVVFVDLALSRSSGAVDGTPSLPYVPQPLINFFQRVIGPRDLYGFLTTRNSVKDLVLAQKTTVTVSEIRDLVRAAVIERDEADDVLGACEGGDALKQRYRADATYTTLETVIAQLGALRQERKNLVLVTDLLPRWRQDRGLVEALAAARRGSVPRTGIQNGRITTDNRDVLTNEPNTNRAGCLSETQRLAMLDFEPRYFALMAAARRENVALYIITPGGLQAPPTVGRQRAVKEAYDDLRSLAENTGGIAATDTNDLNAAFRRIADDMAAYYVLGYYTTNTNFDGGLRKITVKVNGEKIRARSEYRAPTEGEIAALAKPPSTSAPARDEGPPAVIGEPIAYRVTRMQPPERVPRLEFVRTDRLRVVWPVLAPLDRREARMLDTAGKPLPFDLPVSEDPAARTVTVELPLAAFGRGVYSIELTAGAGGKTEHRRLMFTMK
jgi:VWFA-related protein